MQARERRDVVLPALLALGCFAAATGIAWVGSAQEKTVLADVGGDYYRQYCAVCHGSDGAGDGPFANVLSPSPPDLRRIAERRGSFESLAVAEWIDGRRSVRSHGPSDMPIWGESFQKDAPKGAGIADETELSARVWLIVEYLRGIQLGVELAPAPRERTLADVGRDVFRRNCSSCHGLSGRGNGFLGVLLREPPADLTAIAARRGGSYPSLEVAEIIDGRRAVPAHGKREMPVWGDAFGTRFSGSLGKERAVRGEILLLVEYLRSIQSP